MGCLLTHGVKYKSRITAQALGGMSWPHIVLKGLCLAWLSVQVWWYSEFYSKRPLARLSLTDMINHDLIMHYYFTFCVYFFYCLPVEFGFALHPLAAHLMVAVLKFFADSVLYYAMFSVGIKYLHVHYRTTSVSEVLTDTEALKLIRLFATAFNMAVQGCRILGDDRPIWFAMLVGKPEDGYTQTTNIITSLLVITCVGLNIFLRSIMSRERFVTYSALGYSGTVINSKRNGQKIKHAMLPMVLLIMSFKYTLLYSIAGPEDLFQLGELYMMAEMCFFVPAVGIVLHSSLRKFVKKKIQSYCIYIKG